jgi:hypothetical protein
VYGADGFSHVTTTLMTRGTINTGGADLPAETLVANVPDLTGFNSSIMAIVVVHTDAWNEAGNIQLRKLRILNANDTVYRDLDPASLTPSQQGTDGQSTYGILT